MLCLHRRRSLAPPRALLRLLPRRGRPLTALLAPLFRRRRLRVRPPLIRLGPLVVGFETVFEAVARCCPVRQ